MYTDLHISFTLLAWVRKEQQNSEFFKIECAERRSLSDENLDNIDCFVNVALFDSLICL